MKVIEPFEIDLDKPYPPWQFRSKRAIQYEINPSNKNIYIAKVRHTMAVKKSQLGWTYQFNAVIVEDEASVKEVDISVLCLFKHGPIVVYEKTVHDVNLESLRILVKNKRTWWQLEENEKLSECHFVLNTDKRLVIAVQFEILEKETGKVLKTHITNRKTMSLES